MNHIYHSHEPSRGNVEGRRRGVLVADRVGDSTIYAIHDLEERGTFFIEPGVKVYEGMIVGENARDEDMIVNICRTKKMTNMRSSTEEATYRLAPPTILSLERALEYINEDELVEITPKSIRLRKQTLSGHDRKKLTKTRDV
jgi:GTP-binding protein